MTLHRQEAHEIALQRAQKAEEYRKERILQQLEFKEERSNAIKQGFQMLSQMRTNMKDIMVKTNLELKVGNFSSIVGSRNYLSIVLHL